MRRTGEGTTFRIGDRQQTGWPIGFWWGEPFRFDPEDLLAR
jgi:hypothetical protein